MLVTSPSHDAANCLPIPVFTFRGLENAHALRAIDLDEPLDLEEICSGEWLDWYALTPQQRWSESQKLWATFLALGGSYDPEPDTQSPFFDAEASGESAPHGRTSLRVVRRSGV